MCEDTAELILLISEMKSKVISMKKDILLEQQILDRLKEIQVTIESSG